MIDYIKGNIAELSPTQVVLDNNGIGFDIEISLLTYQALEGKTEAKIYIYHYQRQREDIQAFYGFATRDERELFLLIIGVSGIGVGSARMMLSSMTPDELRQAILSEDVNRIKSVKGIGLKSAQRMIWSSKTKSSRARGQIPERCSKSPAPRLQKKPPGHSPCLDSAGRISIRLFSPYSRRILERRLRKSSKKPSECYKCSTWNIICQSKPVILKYQRAKSLKFWMPEQWS